MTEKIEENELGPKLLSDDTAYGRDEDVLEVLNNRGGEVIYPTPGKETEGEVKLTDRHTDKY